MGKSMDRGNSGRNNKPKLSIEDKKQKKKMKQMAKKASPTPTPRSSNTAWRTSPV